MKSPATYSLIVSIFFICVMISCRSLGFRDSFFDMLLNTPDVNIHLIYSNQPFFEEEDGVTYEIYKVDRCQLNNILHNMTKGVLRDSVYNRYNEFSWRIYTKKDSSKINEFIAELERINYKFERKKIFYEIIENGNFYYTILSDSLQREKLFVLDWDSGYLYYISKYEV